MSHPTQNDEEVGVGERVTVADQVLSALELRVEEGEPRREIAAQDFFPLIGRLRIEHRVEATLVQFAANEIEQFLEAIALHRADRRRQLLLGHAVRDPRLQDRIFGQDLAVVG